MGRKHKRAKTDDIQAPTPEQLASGEYVRVLLADHKVSPYRRVPVIDTLHSTGRISTRQFRALGRFRDIMEMSDASPIGDSVGKAMHSAGGGSPGSRVPSSLLGMYLDDGDWLGGSSYLERELGSLRAIAEAVALRDMTLSTWAMMVAGTLECRRTDKRGRVVISFEPHRHALAEALVDIRMAGERLAAAIGA